MARAPTTLAARKFKCTHLECQAAFAYKSELKRHGLSHSGARPFACTFAGCESTFQRTNTLRDHELIHSASKPHVCNYGKCRAAFRQKGALQRRNCAHLKIRPHECTFQGCGAAFTQAKDLRDHDRTHTGSKPFACAHEGCGKAFRHKNTLVLHTRTHTGSKPYSCTHEGCGTSFARQTALVIHTRTHTGELPYKCPIPDCEAAFITSTNCKNHHYYHHTAEGQQRRKKEEERVARVLTSAGIDFKREHHVSFSCTGGTYARTDFTIVERGKVVVLEVDEYQHKPYAVACEVSRMAKLFKDWLLERNALPVYFIRYNPHEYHVDGKKARVPKKVREARLLGAIQEAIESEGDGMRVRYMYYDVVSGKPEIMKDPAFCCVEAIV